MIQKTMVSVCVCMLTILYTMCILYNVDRYIRTLYIRTCRAGRKAPIETSLTAYTILF